MAAVFDFLKNKCNFMHKKTSSLLTHRPSPSPFKFKVACLVRQSPLYLADDWCLVSDSTRRSADVSTCVVPPTLSSYGDRTFAAAGPRPWNYLPVQLRNPDITYGLFRRQLKGHLFREARTRRSMTSDRPMRRHRKTLTYTRSPHTHIGLGMHGPVGNFTKSRHALEI